MNLKLGDLVRTEDGDVGRVAEISKLTIFVEFASGDTLAGYLESQLTKIEPKEYDPNADPRD